MQYLFLIGLGLSLVISSVVRGGSVPLLFLGNLGAAFLLVVMYFGPPPVTFSMLVWVALVSVVPVPRFLELMASTRPFALPSKDKAVICSS